MRYIFENETALALYCTITREMGIEMEPGNSFEDEVYLTEEFLTDTLNDIHTKFKKKENGKFSLK